MAGLSTLRNVALVVVTFTSLVQALPNTAQPLLVQQLPIPSNGQVPIRQEIRTYIQNSKNIDLYILALEQLQLTNQNADNSFYSIGGIHGRPYRPWNGVTGKDTNGLQTGGYCAHADILFPTWHRPYMALYEQALYKNVVQIANSYPSGSRAEYQKIAATWRMPYWDWALDCTLPDIIGSQQQLTVNSPQGQRTLANPLYSYKLNPLDPSQLPDRPFNSMQQTVRNPTYNNGAYLSNVGQLNSKLAQIGPALTKRTYTLITAEKDYMRFSNKQTANLNGANADSVESLHDVIHTTIGGHMGSIDYAALDPLFFLHHTNIDRIFALWQVLNPTSWISPYVGHGTYALPSGVLEDSKTSLTPFRSSANAYWTSDAARNTTAFGYSYPEMEDYTNPVADEKDRLALVVQRINALYSSKLPSNLLRSAQRNSKPPAAKPSSSSSSSRSSSRSSATSSSSSRSSTTSSSSRSSAASSSGSKSSSAKTSSSSSSFRAAGGFIADPSKTTSTFKASVSASSTMSSSVLSGKATPTSMPDSEDGDSDESDFGEVDDSDEKSTGDDFGFLPSLIKSAVSQITSAPDFSGLISNPSDDSITTTTMQHGKIHSFIGKWVFKGLKWVFEVIDGEGDESGFALTTAPADKFSRPVAITSAFSAMNTSVVSAVTSASSTMSTSVLSGVTSAFSAMSTSVLSAEPSTQTSQAPAATGIAALPSVEDLSSHTDQLFSNGSSNLYNEYTADIAVNSNSCNGSFSVFVFLGAVPENSADYAFSPNLVGVHGVFSPIGGGHSMMVTGTVSLTTALINSVIKGDCASLNSNDVNPYLSKQLNWAILDVFNTPVPVQNVESLKVRVVSNEVTIPEHEDEVPKWQPPTLQVAATEGKVGGAQQGDYIQICGCSS